MTSWVDRLNPFTHGLSVSTPLFALIIAITIVAVIVRAVVAPKPASIVKLAAYTFLFAVLGAYVGYSTGASREPVVGAVVPAALTLLGAALAYLFNRKQAASAVWEALSVPSLAAFLLSCVVATVIGGQARREIEQVANQQALCESYYTAFVVPVCLESLKQPVENQTAAEASDPDIRGLCKKLLVGGNPCVPIPVQAKN